MTIADSVVYEQCVGFADIENKTPFQKGSVITLYSLSMPFCAIGLLLLVEKGLVDLDAHLAQYVPEAMGFDERVTVCRLLHHASGLPDFEQDPDFSRRYAPGYPHKIRTHLKLLSKCPSHFAPGTDGKYENENSILCGLIIENVSGMAYADYIKLLRLIMNKWRYQTVSLGMN